MKNVIFTVVLCVACYLSFQLGVWFGTPTGTQVVEEKKAIDISVIESKLAQISELATVSYDYTDIARHEKKEKLWGMTVPFSTSYILVQYSGMIKAGIDLKSSKVSVEDTIITIEMPEARILSHDIDPSSIKILDKNNGLFSSIGVTDFNTFCAAHRDSMEVNALRNGLLETAEQKSEESLWMILAPMKGLGYDIRLVHSKDATSNAASDAPSAQATEQKEVVLPTNQALN